MSSQSILGRFSKSDFFSVLPPGFYIFIVSYTTYSAATSEKADSTILSDILKLSNDIRTDPFLIVFVLFASYLLGSIIRAIPIRFLCRFTPPFHDDFPYPIRLNELINHLRNNRDRLGYENNDLSILPELKDLDKINKKEKFEFIREYSDIYNYWKAVLCINSPGGFDYYETYETRVRFFAGMVWAGLVGIILGIIVYFTTDSHLTSGVLFLVSLLIMFVFRINFHRVRGQEAKELVLLIAAYLKNTEKKKTNDIVDARE